MNIKLNNADFSANGISQIQPTYSVKKITGYNVANLGSGLENGQRLRFRIVIDNASTYAGTTVNFAWSVGATSPGYGIAEFMDGYPQFSMVIQNGASYVGAQTIGKLSETNPSVKIGLYNVTSAYSAINWHIEYYIES